MWAYLDWKGEIPLVPDTNPPASVDYDMWLGPAPTRPFNKNRFHFTFRWYWDYAGGLMTDWGAHMIDIANWGMGVTAPCVGEISRSAASSATRTTRWRRPTRSRCCGSTPSYTMIWEHALGIGRGPEGARARRRLPRATTGCW